MKNNFSRLSVLIVLTGLLLTAIVSCKKDEKKDDSSVIVGGLIPPYRITNILQTEGDDVSETKLVYNSNDKLISFEDFENDVPVYKSTWTWSANEARLTESYFNGSQWIDEPHYQIYTYAVGSKLTEVRMYESQDSLVFKVTFNWAGDRVIKEIREYYHQGIPFGYNESDYFYTGEQLTSIEHSGFGQELQTQIIEYANGKPVSLKTYSDEDVLLESIEMIYTDNLMTKINSYDVSGGVANGLECSEVRMYDDNKNVSAVNKTCNGEDVFTSTLTWEQGTGNISDVVLANIGWLTVYLFPDTFPSELLFTKKSPNQPGIVGTGRDLSIAD